MGHELTEAVPVTSSGDVGLDTIIELLAEDVEVKDRSGLAPASGRVVKDPEDGTIYVGDGAQWLDVAAIVGLDGLVRLARFAESDLPTAGSQGRLVWNTDRKVPAFEDGNDWEYPVVGDDVKTSSTQVNDSTTETEVFSATLDADSMKVGRVYEVNLFGKYNTNDSSTKFHLRFKIGGTTVATITSVAANVTDAPVSARLKFTVRDTGASGTIMAHTESVFDDQHTDVHHGTETIDTTVAEDIDATVEWDSADAGLSVTIGQGYMKEVA